MLLAFQASQQIMSVFGKPISDYHSLPGETALQRFR
jgi:hypothetical protein